MTDNIISSLNDHQSFEYLNFVCTKHDSVWVCLVCWFMVAWLGILAWASQACFQEARGVCLVACDAELG